MSHQTEADIAELETTAMWAWPPIETAWLKGWVLRAGEGHTNRANSVATLAFDAEEKLDEAIVEAERWYAIRGLTACFKICDTAFPKDLDRRLQSKGYRKATPSQVMTMNAPQNTGADRVLGSGRRIELETRPTAAVMNVMCNAMSKDSRDKRSRLLARIKRPTTYALLIENSVPVATGMAVADGSHGSIAAMMVLPERRGKGFGKIVLNRLVDWLSAMHCERIFLQVEADNEPARRLYTSRRFEDLYGYHYRIRRQSA